MMRASAFAKINLYLHVLRKREDGYHDLDSLIAFADFGDEVVITSNQEPSLTIDGPFAGKLSEDEQDLSRSSKNILAKTLWALADLAHKEPDFSITLTKNIPLGAGLGGGSADAAALAKILCKLWNIDPNTSEFQNILFKLGADVLPCFHGKAHQIQNAGESISESITLPNLKGVLVHPDKHCSTVEIFKHNEVYSNAKSLPKNFQSTEELISFLKETTNDLTEAAQDITPEINDVLNALKKQNGIQLARMSGSGSACFGLFETSQEAEHAAQVIKNLHPSWWVQAVKID